MWDVPVLVDTVVAAVAAVAAVTAAAAAAAAAVSEGELGFFVKRLSKWGRASTRPHCSSSINGSSGSSSGSSDGDSSSSSRG